MGLLLDAVCTDMQDVVEDTDVLVALRDDLRDMKAAVEEGGTVQALLGELKQERTAHLELGVAAGNLSKAKRRAAERELDEIAALMRLVDGDGNGKSADEYALVAQAFADKTEALQMRTADVEQRLSRAFCFLEDAFGEGQEMVVFTTELTSRFVSARYIAQYGSASYFAHNEDMILSERQRDLRRRVEDLNI